MSSLEVGADTSVKTIIRPCQWCFKFETILKTFKSEISMDRLWQGS